MKFSSRLKYGVQGILESQHWSPPLGDKTARPESVVFFVNWATGIGLYPVVEILLSICCGFRINIKATLAFMIKNSIRIIPFLGFPDTSINFNMIIIEAIGAIQNSEWAKRMSGAKQNQKNKPLKIGMGTKSQSLFTF